MFLGVQKCYLYQTGGKLGPESDLGHLYSDAMQIRAFIELRDVTVCIFLSQIFDRNPPRAKFIKSKNDKTKSCL